MNEKNTDKVETRKAQLRSVIEAYFGGLAGKDISGVPYHDDVILRAPLAAGGSESPLRGKEAVVGYLNSVLPVLGEARIIDWYVNDSLTGVCSAAEVDVTNPKTTLRVADRFKVDAEGRITEQENHFDPRNVTTPGWNKGR